MITATPQPTHCAKSTAHDLIDFVRKSVARRRNTGWGPFPHAKHCYVTLRDPDLCTPGSLALHFKSNHWGFHL